MRFMILLMIVLSVIFYFGQQRIQKIDCQINQTPCRQELKEEFSQFLGENFFLSRPQKKIKALQAAYPHWQKLEIKKVPFNKIVVSITVRQPAACLSMEGRLLLLDQEAVVVAEVSVNPGLPEIEVSQFQEKEVKAALRAIELLGKHSLEFERLEITSGNQIVVLFPETKAFLPLEELGDKIASLQIILSQAKIEGKLPSKVDLRFKKPVITFENGSN